MPTALLCCICSVKRLLKVSADLTLGRPYVLEWSIVTGFWWIFSLYMNKPQIKREFDPNSLTLLSILVLLYSLLVATLTKSWPVLCFHTLHFDCSVDWGAWSVFHNAKYLQKVTVHSTELTCVSKKKLVLKYLRDARSLDINCMKAKLRILSFFILRLFSVFRVKYKCCAAWWSEGTSYVPVCANGLLSWH